jgi:hypothetical protein
MKPDKWEQKKRLCAGCESLYREATKSGTKEKIRLINCDMTPVFEGKE